jgi:hypothetical protein
MVRNMVAELYSTLSEDMKTRARKKIQSAMEYLMTYGWAILIISVVLVVLFSMGITNPLFLAPKATSGGCRVVRTSAAQSLEGICNGEIPQYVAQFNGQSSYIDLMSNYQIPTHTTLSMWVLPNSLQESTIFTWNNGGIWYGLFTVGGGILSDYGGYVTEGSYNANKWIFVVFNISDSGGYAAVGLYVNGFQNPPELSPLSYPTGTGTLQLGESSCCGYGYLSGQISDVQLYNTSLDSASVNALYQEGIGGAPIVLQNLVGWWPLNGNANDYSGNNNDGTASNVIWSGTWWQSYTQP